MFNRVFVFSVWLVLTEISECAYIGDFCTLDATGETGQCDLLEKCPQAIQALTTQHILPQNCGFDGAKPIVCCVQSGGTGPVIQTTTKPTTTTTRRTTTTRKITTTATTKPTTTTKSVTEDPNRPRQIGDRAREKCIEYGDYVYVTIPSPVLLPGNSATIKKNECGHREVKLIVGGVKASPKEFPHMALIGYDQGGEKVWKCGGSLISENYVLTAGHCLFSREFGYAKFVRLGDLDIRSTTDNARPQEINVEPIKYPSYSSKLKYNDIGLLKLAKPAVMSGYVRPACLYTRDIVNASKAIATGWGKVAYAGAESEFLMKVTLDIFTNRECNESYPDENKLDDGIIDTQMCAGSFEGEEKDTCQGDSGGPLQIYNTAVYCTYYIIGVTSFGKACGIGTPGVYTRVSKYIDWIENIVWP